MIRTIYSLSNNLSRLSGLLTILWLFIISLSVNLSSLDGLFKTAIVIIMIIGIINLIRMPDIEFYKDYLVFIPLFGLFRIKILYSELTIETRRAYLPEFGLIGERKNFLRISKVGIVFPIAYVSNALFNFDQIVNYLNQNNLINNKIPGNR